MRRDWELDSSQHQELTVIALQGGGGDCEPVLGSCPLRGMEKESIADRWTCTAGTTVISMPVRSEYCNPVFLFGTSQYSLDKLLDFY